MKNITSYIHQLLDSGNFEEARKSVLDLLEGSNGSERNLSLFQQVNLNFLLIDIGCDTSNEEDIERAIIFFVDNEDEIKKIITISSYYYNLANAKKELGKIYYNKNKGVHSISSCREKFQEPINLYWLAYKNVGTADTFLNEILINLSNALMMNFRIVEALQMLDTVLKDNPKYPQALISRGENLNCLSLITNCSVSIALYAQIYSSYEKGIESGILPQNILRNSLHAKDEATKKMLSYNSSTKDIATEIEDSRKEYEQHSNYRKFCINNFLTLNEHSLYCNCVATSKDELQIGNSYAVFRGEALPKLELLLNRIKSEYAFARWNYYKSFTEEAFDYDVIFSELFEDEVINSQSEALRASYRICYGILDKIALGICKLYKVEGGNIYFERFWEDKSRKEILEKQRNIHLNALSSIANDLNTQRGELRHFKNWRNKLEHNLLILQRKPKLNIDAYNILEDKDFIVAVDIDDFRQKTIHLLQLTRAAVFSFVYCIRLETITNNDPAKTPTIKIGTKN